MPFEAVYDASKMYPDDLNGMMVSESRLCGIINRYPVRRSAVPFYSIDMYAGNNRTFRVFVKTADLDVVDLTGAVGIFTVKKTKDDASPSVQKRTDVAGEGQIGAADEGEMFFYLEPSDTSSLDIMQYVFDVTVVLASGNSYTVLEGVVNLLQAVR